MATLDVGLCITMGFQAAELSGYTSICREKFPVAPYLTVAMWINGHQLCIYKLHIVGHPHKPASSA